MRKYKRLLTQLLTSSLVAFVSILTTSLSYANDDLISLFPLNNYDQSLSTWIKSTDADFDQPLLSNEMQKRRMDIFYEHHFGSLSPWNADYVNQIFQQSPSPKDLKTMEQTLINYFSNENKSDDQIGYGENFRPHSKDWIEKIASNIHLSQFDHVAYQNNRRGIAIDNLHTRILPTDDVHFYNPKLAGQGYPFDNLQISALWAGTPVYIIGETRDHAWLLVLTPDYIGWVKSSGIAKTDNAFVNAWTKAAKNKLMAITQTQTSVVDEKGRFLFLAYVGSVFPGTISSSNIKIMVPEANDEGNAVIKHAIISAENIASMPISATPHHFKNIMQTLIGRPYGWGGMYFYNDCSAELKSLLTPFGIWIPRHSSDEVTAGEMVDMSLAPQEKRLSYLMENGKRFLTLIYIGGHIVMYIGNYPNPNNNSSLMAMTYQNMWGLSPNPPTRRAVVGQSVLFPMLLQYPEDSSLVSLANKKYFQVSYLTQLPSKNLLSRKPIDLESLMCSKEICH